MHDDGQDAAQSGYGTRRDHLRSYEKRSDDHDLNGGSKPLLHFLFLEFEIRKFKSESFQGIRHILEALAKVTILNMICPDVIHCLREIHLIKVTKHLIKLVLS